MNVGTAVTGSAGATAGSASNGKGQSSGVTPFIRASQLHREGAFFDKTVTLTANSADLGSITVPAYGYLRNIVIQVEASGGAGAATFAEDGPFTALQNIYLSEPNGATIAQFSSGYNLFLANKYGGYVPAPYADPRYSTAFTANTTGGNFSYILRVPVELNPRDGLGSLPNQNAASSYTLRLTLAGNGTIYSSVPATTQPNVRVRLYLEAWDQPEVSTNGIANQTTPPAMNTTQFWSEQIFPVNSGQQTIRLTRMGNYIRNLVFVYRRSAGTRANGEADWPDPLTLYWDTRPLDLVAKLQWRNQVHERYGYGYNTESTAGGSTTAGVADTPGQYDNGVFPYDFCHEFDGNVGYENRDLWLPTLSSTRWELQGNFANAGTLTVLTNDVSIAGNVFL
jgi:hypothetical protein